MKNGSAVFKNVCLYMRHGSGAKITNLRYFGSSDFGGRQKNIWGYKKFQGRQKAYKSEAIKNFSRGRQMVKRVTLRH